MERVKGNAVGGQGKRGGGESGKAKAEKRVVKRVKRGKGRGRAVSGITGKKTEKAVPRRGGEKRATEARRESKEKVRESKVRGREKPASKLRRRAKAKGPIVPKSDAIKAVAERVKRKPRFLFRGRFGKRSVRRRSKKKWQRWRKPRGIDIRRRREDGLYPKTGYRTDAAIRGRHPSGYAVVLVRNEGELEAVAASALKDSTAVRLAASLGKRKRIVLLERAEKLGLVVLNA